MLKRKKKKRKSYFLFVGITGTESPGLANPRLIVCSPSLMGFETFLSRPSESEAPMSLSPRKDWFNGRGMNLSVHNMDWWDFEGLSFRTNDCSFCHQFDHLEWASLFLVWVMLLVHSFGLVIAWVTNISPPSTRVTCAGTMWVSSVFCLFLT